MTSRGAVVAIGLALGALLFSHSSAAVSADDFRAEPHGQEKLSPSVQLNCVGMEIIEWRASRYFTKTSTKSDDGIGVMNHLCTEAVTRYPSFLAHKKFTYIKKPIIVKIALMPANTLLDGKDFRNLNDFTFRFKSALATGCCIWGFYHDPSNSLYLRNDPIRLVNGKTITNKYFARTFLHEMAHVFNHQWEVRNQNFFGDNARDEEVAEEWVTWLGYKFGTESSEDDLKFKNVTP